MTAARHPSVGLCDATKGSKCEFTTNFLYVCYCHLPNGNAITMNGTTCGVRNECTKDNGGCAHRCVNEPTGFRCECFTGDDFAGSLNWPSPIYQLSDNKYDCLDIDECADPAFIADDGVCPASSRDCINNPGFFFCLSKSGALAKSGVVEAAVSGSAEVSTSAAVTYGLIAASFMVVIVVIVVLGVVLSRRNSYRDLESA